MSPLLVCAFLCGMAAVNGQFQLFFGTTTQSGPRGYDPNCRDKMTDCHKFDDSACRAPYLDWAKENCPQRCGFCMGPTTPSPPCMDKIKTCETYGKGVCTKPEYKTWVYENCRYYCRLCSPAELARLDAMTTVISPQNCVDRVDCRQYGANACSAQFKPWAKDNCPRHCGFCVGIPTPPPTCDDKVPNCKEFNSDTCTNPKYKIWVEDNCRRHCGLCAGGPVTAAPNTGGYYPVPPNPGSGTSGGSYPVPPNPNSGSGSGSYPVPPNPRQDPAVISYATPPVSGKKRSVAKRQFHASHHHFGGEHMCWDHTGKWKSDDPYCKTPAPGTLTTESPEIIPTGGFPGASFHPRPTPTEGWDRKPTTTEPTTTTTTVPTTTTTEATTTTTIEPVKTTEVPATTTTTEAPTETTPSDTTTTTQETVKTTAVPDTTLMPDTTLTPQSSIATNTQTASTSGVSSNTGASTYPSSSSLTESPVGVSTSQSPVSQTSASQTISSSTDGSSSSPSSSTSNVEVTSSKVTSIITNITSAPTASSTVSGGTSASPQTAPPSGSTAGSTGTTEIATPVIVTTIKTGTTEVVTPAIVTTGTTATTTTAGKCEDTIDNCAGYGEAICHTTVYKPWATAHCSAFCQFCTPVTLTPFKCENVLPNCHEFDSGDLCTAKTYFAWSRANCFAYCGFPPCGKTNDNSTSTTQALQSSNVTQVVTTAATKAAVTLAPGECKDVFDNCLLYPDSQCVSIYSAWAKAHCAKRCGYCNETIPCVDENSDCALFPSDICSNSEYAGWARENCRKFCNLCTKPTSNPQTGQSSATPGAPVRSETPVMATTSSA